MQTPAFNFNLRVITPLLLAGALTLAIACGSDSDDDDGGGGTTLSPPSETTPVATMTVPPDNGETNDRQDFITTVEAQLEQLQTQMDELESEVASMSGEDQAAAQARIDGLKDRKVEIEAELAEVESASDADYEAKKVEIEERVEVTMTEAQDFADELGI
jgi:TolA-binding protein